MEEQDLPGERGTGVSGDLGQGRIKFTLNWPSLSWGGPVLSLAMAEYLEAGEPQFDWGTNVLNFSERVAPS